MLDAIGFQVSVAGFQISGSRTPLLFTELPPARVWPASASTSPSGSTVSVSNVRDHFIGLTSRQAGTVWSRSSTAARLVTGTLAGKSGSVHVPALRILPGRYITALCPSMGDRLASVDHVPDWTSRIRVVVSGPASTTRPSGVTNVNGYSGICRPALGSRWSVFVAGS